MVTVRSPNPTFSGERCGLVFERGVAESAALTPRAEAWFQARGYTLERAGAGSPSEQEAPTAKTPRDGAPAPRKRSRKSKA